MQGAGRTETSSNQDRIGTRRGRIDAAWESQKRKKGIGSEDILSSKGNDRRIEDRKSKREKKGRTWKKKQ